MPSEAEVEAGAKVMADLPTIDAPKLPASCWEGSARVILEAAERVRDDERRKSCKHPRAIGNGMVSSDGASSTSWTCPDCGEHYSYVSPARASNPNPLGGMLVR